MCTRCSSICIFNFFDQSLGVFTIIFLCIKFSLYRYFTALVKFFPWYFNVFYAIVSRIVFFISCSGISLWGCRNAIVFCVLILYLTTLLNSLMNSNNFFLIWGIFLYTKSYHLHILKLTSSFPIGCFFISLSCLIFLSKTSSTILSKSGDNGHTVYFPPDFLKDKNPQNLNYERLKHIKSLFLDQFSFMFIVLKGIKFLGQPFVRFFGGKKHNWI